MAVPEFLALTSAQREIQRLAADFGSTRIAPHAAAWDSLSHFDRPLVREMGALGLLGMLIPEEYGGLGSDTVTYLLALEEIAVADASVAVLMSVHNSLPTQMILRYGTPEQRQRYLPPMACGDLIGAFALSEPDAGSDASALRVHAVADQDGYVLNGTKAWVTSGSEAGVILVFARTDRSTSGRNGSGISAFIVTPELSGFRVGKKEDKMGLRASPTAQIVLDNLRVPADRLLGEPGRGFAYAMESLEQGRLGIAAQAVGIARAALAHAVRYASERVQFGVPIKDHQGIQFKLADMAARITSARALLYAAAAAKDRGERVTQLAAMAKLVASETASWVASQAVQVFGANGYMKDYPVERLFRDARATEIYEGTSEIQRIVIARELYRDHPRSRSGETG